MVTLKYFPTSANDPAPALVEAIGAIAEGTSSVTEESPPVAAGGAAEQEIQTRLASVNVGVGLSLLVAAGSAVYALVTWDQPHRAGILAITVIGLLSAPLLWALRLSGSSAAAGATPSSWAGPWWTSP
jgi:hypothetical protein